MRILHVVPSYLPALRYGGPIKSVHGLCKALAARGHDVHVFTTDADGDGRLAVPLGVPVDLEGVSVWYFPTNWLRRLYWSPPMRTALRAQVASFDLVHLHSIFLWPTTSAARCARKNGVPYVLSPRGMLVGELIRQKSRWIKRAWIALFERRNIAQAAMVHYTSRLEREEAERLHLEYREACVVPNGVDPEESHPLPGAGVPPADNGVDDAPFLLFVGRVSWEKGLDRLIAALPLIPGCNLVVAGGGEDEYREALVALARKHGVAARLKFIGPVYGSRKQALFRSALVLVLPSYSENFGNVVLEAMAEGCPVAVTTEVGAADIVRESGAGVVLDGSPEALGHGIAEVISGADLRREMGRRGREAVAEGYSWDRIAARMEEVYRQVLDNTPRRRASRPAAGPA